VPRYPGIVDDREPAPDEAPEPEYDESGVDLSLIRSTLALTPAERLECAEQVIVDVLAIRALNAK
jgi:hypothetical protein